MWPFISREKRDFTTFKTQLSDAQDRVKELIAFYASQTDELRRLRSSHEHILNTLAAIIWNANEIHTVRVPLVDIRRKLLLIIGGDVTSNEQVYSAHEPPDDHNAR